MSPLLGLDGVLTGRQLTRCFKAELWGQRSPSGCKYQRKSFPTADLAGWVQIEAIFRWVKLNPSVAASRTCS